MMAMMKQSNDQHKAMMKQSNDQMKQSAEHHEAIMAQLTRPASWKETFINHALWVLAIFVPISASQHEDYFKERPYIGFLFWFYYVVCTVLYVLFRCGFVDLS